MKALKNTGAIVIGVLLSMSFGGNAIAGSGSENDERQLASATSAFGFRILKELVREQPGANVFISPYSISSVLQMLSNGARGQTQNELEQVLGTRGLSIEAMNQAYADLSQSISSSATNAVLNLANSLWYRYGAELQPDFASANQRFYRAKIQALDFSEPHSVEVMNDWASENTHGKIQKMVQPPLPGDTMMIVANAIYFKGTWLDPFDAKQTKPRPFYTSNHASRPLPMMLKTRTFAYEKADGFQAIQLPYSGQQLQMEVLLPDSRDGLEALINRVDAGFWQSTVLTGFHQSRGTLILPKFHLTYGNDLKKSLTALGLKDAWTAGADFSGISSSKLLLSEVKHQSFVEVNEQGTEAAAVTTGAVALTSVMNQPPPFEMIVDHPFLFAISDRQTHSLLFLGAVLEPGD